MSDALSEHRSLWWDARLENWALWKRGANSCGTGWANDGEWGEGAPRPPEPLVGSALDTDALVKRLAMSALDAVTAWYVWTGTIEDRAGALGIHRNTLRNRVDAAKGELDAMWWERIGAVAR